MLRRIIDSGGGERGEFVVHVVPEEPSSGDEVAEGAGVIKVFVEELNQLFDSMDPSPFHEKSLDRNAHEYIVSIAKELPAGAPAALVVYLARSGGLPDEARLLRDAIRVYFARRRDAAVRELRQHLRWGWINLSVGLTLLVASVLVGEFVTRRMAAGPLATVLRESLLIGGWVAMWRPMDFFLYELWAMRSNIKVYDQLSRAAVRIVYAAPSPGAALAAPDSGSGTASLPSTAVGQQVECRPVGVGGRGMTGEEEADARGGRGGRGPGPES